MPKNSLPQRGRAHVLGEEAVDAVKRCFPIQWIKREGGPADYGNDMVVEIVKGTDVTPIKFYVQIKGKDRIQEGNQDTLKITGIKATTINYWRIHIDRVMIAAYLAEKNLVVWRWVDNIPEPETEETTVAIPLKNKLSEVDWKEFTKNLDKYYRLVLETKWQTFGTLKSTTKPSLAGDRKRKPLASLDAECTLDIFKEATILQYNGNVGIIDCGRNSQDEVIEWLKTNYVRKLEFIAVSHLHIDHYGGVTRILEEVDSVRSFFLPPISDPHFAAVRFEVSTAFVFLLGAIQNLIDTNTLIYFFSQPNWQLSLGKTKSGHPIQLEIYFPYEGLTRFATRPRGDHNNICPVFRVSIGKSSFLLSGDATQSVWEELIASNGEKIRSSGILLPHYGDFKSISNKILDQVLHKGAFPAVYQPLKRYRFPQKETLDLVTKKGGILINVEHRPAHIRLDPERMELQ